MSSEAERQAMLEKIRSDMQATRERLSDLRSRKMSVIAPPPSFDVLAASGGAGPVVVEAAVVTPSGGADSKAKLTQAASLIEKMKADREAKKLAASTNSQTAPVEQPNEVLPPPTESTPQEAKEEPGVDAGSTAPSTSQVGGRRGRRPNTGKNINSLEDLQKAIQKADRVKKQAESAGKLGDIRRHTDEVKKKAMTREERKAYRQSKRLTVEMQHSESRVKVNTQISQFMGMIQLLEAEWQKGEEDRIKREAEMDEQRAIFDKASGQMGFLSNALSEMSNQMESMKTELDNLVESASKTTKKEERWFGSQFLSFQENFLEMRHQAYISSAKQKKMMTKTQKEADDLAKEMKAPPPPLPTDGSGPKGMSANPISSSCSPIEWKRVLTTSLDLLSQIRLGTDLKKLDPTTVQQERQQRKGDWRQSVQLLETLQATLCDALDQRHLALFSDSDEEDDFGDDDGWDD